MRRSVPNQGLEAVQVLVGQRQRIELHTLLLPMPHFANRV